MDEFRNVAEELWDQAVDDSGLDPTRLHRFEVAGVVMEGAGAQWWAPGESVRQPPARLDVSEEDADALDKPPLVGLHRIATAPVEGLEQTLAEAVLAGKLRHELEHARQWEAAGQDPFELLSLAWGVHKERTGGTIYGGFVNQIPIEDDANAAASLFVRKVRPDSVKELAEHETYGSLGRAVLGPSDPDTLVVRMAAFLFHYRDTIREMAGGASDVMWIEQLAPSAVPAWTALSKAAG